MYNSLIGATSLNIGYTRTLELPRFDLYNYEMFLIEIIINVKSN